MPLVRSQEDEFHHIESDLHATPTGRWRVSTRCSQRSYDLRSSSKPASWEPRFPSKAASRTTAAHRVVRLERIQEDEDDGCPTHQLQLPQITMEASDQTGEVDEGAYTCSTLSSADARDQVDPTILNSPTHDLENPFCFTFDDSEDFFHRFRRDPRNIVLDSALSEIAPHIVITPPEFDWGDFTVMHENAPPPQQHPEQYLCVPGSSPTSLFATAFPKDGADRGVRAPVFVTTSEELESDLRAGDTTSANCTPPKCVFSPSLFVATIEATSQERELMPHLLRALYKRLFSACAAVASDVARTLNSRYSSLDTISELFSHLESPVTWSDPALPLLSCFFRFPGALIIDSVTPFTIPHIVITEPPIWDYNPYVNMHNCTQSPQDAGWGQSLVVPSPVVDFINLPEDDPFGSSETMPGCSITDQCAQSETELDVWEPESPSEESGVVSPESTALQTPGLLTPIGEEEEFDLMVFASSPPDGSSLVGDDEQLLEDTPQDVEIYCEDEDDLPPLDGWYQGIAARSGYILSA